MDKVFEVSLGHTPEEKSHARASLELPATPCDLGDALDRDRIRDGGDLTMKITWAVEDLRFLTDGMGEWTCKPTELFLLNALAEKYLRMDLTEFYAFEGMIRMELEKGKHQIPTARLYDLASSVDCCHVVPEATDDASLGRFYVDGGFLPEYENLPETILSNLDYAKIGREAREGEGGVFVEGGGYVVQHSEFVEAAKDFVPQEPDYAVLLEARRGEQAVTLKLPATPQEMDAALDAVGAADWKDVDFQCVDCQVPDLVDVITECGSVEQANRAAQTLDDLTNRQMTVYKALLEAKGCSSLDEAVKMAGQLDQYILSPEFASAEDVGLSCLQTIMGDDEAALIQPYVNLYAYGASMIQRFHYSMTTYGAIERRDGEPVREVSGKQPDAGRNAGNHQSKPQRKHREPSR